MEGGEGREGRGGGGDGEKAVIKNLCLHLVNCNIH